MSERTLPRPPQVTFSGWAILVGSVIVLVSVYDTVANLRSIDTREEVERMLSEPPLSGTGLGLERVLDMMHGASLVAGGCAAAMAVLGFFVLRRHQQARIGVSVLAVPLFLCGLVVGGFAASMVAVAAVLLWTRPARDWFAGRTPEPTSRPAARAPQWPERPVAPPRREPSAHGSLPQPTAHPASEQQPDPNGPRAWSDFGAPQTPEPGRASRRPREVISACIMVWVFGGMALASTLTALVMVPSDDTVLRDLYEQDERFADSGVTLSALRATVLALSAGLALWALAAVVLALFAFLRHNWARWALFGSSVATAVFSLLLVIGAPMMLVLTGVAVYAAVLLTRPSVAAWYRDKSPGA